MGIEYSASLVVGYTYDEIVEIFSPCPGFEGELYEVLDTHDLSLFPPYYDADLKACIFGRSVLSSGDYSSCIVGIYLDERATSIGNELVATYGKTPNLYLTVVGY